MCYYHTAGDGQRSLHYDNRPIWHDGWMVPT